MEAINKSDKYLVINTTTGKAIESHATEQRAEHAASVLNEHEVRNNRQPVYAWQSVA